MVVSLVDQDQIKKLEIKDSKKKQSKAHAFAYEFKLFKSSGDFGWANYNTDVHFDVDPNSSHRREQRRQEPAKRYQGHAKKKCSNDIRPERKRTNRSQQFQESLKKALNEPFILEKTDGDLIRISIGYSFKVYSINSQTTYSVIIDQNPRCTCPYFMKKPRNRNQIRKHILSVYVRVYWLPENSSLLQKTALIKAECQDILKGAPSFVPISLCQQKVQANEHHSHLTSRELDALFSDYDNLPQRWVPIKLNEGSTAHCAGCLKSKVIAGRLCIVVNAKFVPKDCYFAVDRKFYFCAVAQCLKNKPRSSNLRCAPEKVEADRAIDGSTKQLLKARNIPLC